jgi:predicted Zn-dependent protease
LLKRGQKPLLGEIDVGRYRKAYGNLVALLRRLGRTTEADEWLVAMAREDPGYLPAGVAAAEVLLRSGRLDELEQLLQGLEGAHPASADVVLLRARSLVARGQSDRAREHLRAAVTRVTQPERVSEMLGRLGGVSGG